MDRAVSRRSSSSADAHIERLLRLAGVLLCGFSVVSAQKTSQSVRVVVQSTDGKPLAGVSVRVVNAEQSPSEVISISTASDGTATVQCPPAPVCTVDLMLAGYLPALHTLDSSEIRQGTTFQIVLNRTMQREENVTVRAEESAPLLQPESNRADLQIESVKTTPLRPSTLIDTLPLVPGVSRTSDGRVIIECADESHSALLINSVNVTDPATGSFGLSVPVDSVEDVKVSISPFLARYGSLFRVW